MKQTTCQKAAELGLWAARSAVQGHELGAFVWGFGAAHFGRKALDAGARLTPGGWVGGDREERVRALDSWVDGGDPPDFEARSVELVCRTPGCRGAQLCDDCRAQLDRYGEPGRAGS